MSLIAMRGAKKAPDLADLVCELYPTCSESSLLVQLEVMTMEPSRRYMEDESDERAEIMGMILMSQ